jgi:hypothetical protein
MLSEWKHKNKRKKVKYPNGETGPNGEKWYYEYEQVPYWQNDKAPKVPKWAKDVDKKASASKQKSNLRVTDTEWELMELQKQRKDIRSDCNLKGRILAAQYEEFYKKYPHKRPKIVPPPTKSEKEIVPCSNPKFALCEAVVYTHHNGNRKIVTTEKLPVVQKPKKIVHHRTKKFKWKRDGQHKNVQGIADCGCRLR